MDEKFYLYQCGCCNRLFISNEHEKGAVAISETAAKLWIEAKENLGFPLTIIQRDILNKETNKEYMEPDPEDASWDGEKWIKEGGPQ